MNKQRILRAAIAAAMLGGAVLVGATQGRAAGNVCSTKSSSWTDQISCRSRTTVAQGITDAETGQPQVLMIIGDQATGESAGAVGLDQGGQVVCSTGLINLPGNTGKSFRSEACPGGKYVGLQHFY